MQIVYKFSIFLYANIIDGPPSYVSTHFIWGQSFHSRIFHSYGDDTIIGERQQILTYARHSWPLSSEGSSPTVTRIIRL